MQKDINCHISFSILKKKSHTLLSWFPSNSFSTSQQKFILTMTKPGSGIEVFIA